MWSLFICYAVFAASALALSYQNRESSSAFLTPHFEEASSEPYAFPEPRKEPPTDDEAPDEKPDEASFAATSDDTASAVHGPSKVMIPIGNTQVKTGEGASAVTTETGGEKELASAEKDAIHAASNEETLEEEATSHMAEESEAQRQHMEDTEVNSANSDLHHAEREEERAGHNLRMKKERDHHGEAMEENKMRAQELEEGAQLKDLDDQVTELQGEDTALGDAEVRVEGRIQRAKKRGSTRMNEAKIEENESVDKAVEEAELNEATAAKEKGKGKGEGRCAKLLKEEEEKIAEAQKAGGGSPCSAAPLPPLPPVRPAFRQMARLFWK